MNSDMALRVGSKVPDKYKKMQPKIKCGNCGATFSIIHEEIIADAARAEKQQGNSSLAKRLAEEHADANFKDHLPSYDLADF